MLMYFHGYVGVCVLGGQNTTNIRRYWSYQATGLLDDAFSASSNDTLSGSGGSSVDDSVGDAAGAAELYELTDEMQGMYGFGVFTFTFAFVVFVAMMYHDMKGEFCAIPFQMCFKYVCCKCNCLPHGHR
jgi:hypothetical protein